MYSLISTFFQALQYLRKLCNHPSLVLTPQHPEYKRITEQLACQNSNLRDIQHAPKLSALKQVNRLSDDYIHHFCLCEPNFGICYTIHNIEDFIQ